MLYYLITGNISSSTYAKNHKHAAQLLCKNENESDIGRYIIVDTKKINYKDIDQSAMFFSTDLIIEEIKNNTFEMKLTY